MDYDGLSTPFRTNMNGHDPEDWHSLSFRLPYSHEELRLHDYQQGRGPKSPTHSTPAFGLRPDGLVPAAVPDFRPASLTCSRRTPAASAVPLGSKFVTFRAGVKDATQDFAIHENLVSRRSDFVRMAMSNDWKEAHERIIPMPEDDPETFQLYQQWVYTATIPSRPTGYGDPKDAQEYRLLTNAYIMGARLLDSDFKDAIIDAIINKLLWTKIFDPSLTNLVYEGTAESSALRRLWLDIYAWTGNDYWLDEKNLEEEVHQGFAVDLGRYQMRLKSGIGVVGGAPFLRNQHYYHEHRDGTCYLDRYPTRIVNGPQHRNGGGVG